MFLSSPELKPKNTECPVYANASCITLNLKTYIFDKGLQAAYFLQKPLTFANPCLLQHIDCQDVL